MKRLGWLVIAVLVLALPFTLAVMQDEESISIDIIGVDASALPKVVVNASVLDETGQLISGLGVEDFTIGGDLADIGTITNVENITDDNLAFASVLVIDTSSSMAGFPLEQVKEAARRYIGALGANDPVAIMSFDSEVLLVQDYTTDKNLLLSAIDNVGFGGQTALYDATLQGIEKADEAPLPRSAVIILSDGGEYGGVSMSTREDSFAASSIRGVPVYTVGLGWQIDRRFLEVIANDSNADFFESPTPDELIGIYDNLAFLFRTQYIITLDVPVAADGTRYNFTIEATAPDGRTASDSATLRAPVPTPILSLPEDLFVEPIGSTTTVTAMVNADDAIASTEYNIGETVVSTTESYTIDPATTAPGIYTLDIAVTDVDGDTGTLSADFEVAALPPTLSTDFAPEAGVTLSEPQTVTATAGGQTDITSVDFAINGVVVTSDTDSPYNYTIVPFDLPIGGHILTVTANNAGGQATSVDTAFAIASLPPQIAVSGLTTDTVLSDTVTANIVAVGQSAISDLNVTVGEDVIASVVDSDSLSVTLNAVDFAPGTASVDVNATDSDGASTTETISFTVSALPPTIEISGLTAGDIITGDLDVTVNASGQTEITLIDVAYNDDTATTITGSSFTIPTENLGDGEHNVTITVTNAGGQSDDVTIPFVVNLPPTPTFTPTATFTPSATDTSEPSDTPQATDTAEPTDTDAPTDTVEPTDVATEVPTVTADESGNVVVPTDTQEPTDEPTETNTEEPPDTPEPTETDTEVPTETDTEEPTATPSPTTDTTGTAVAMAQIVEEETADAQATIDADATESADNATATADAVLTADAQETLDVESTEAAINVRATADTRSTQQADNSTATADAIIEATNDAESTVNAVATADAEETANALATTNAEETASAQQTADAEDEEATEVAANANATASEEAEPTETEEAPTDAPTDEPTEVLPTATDAPTEEDVEEPTAQATLTPVTITEVDAPTADQQDATDNSTAVIAIGIGLLLLLLLFFFGRRRGQ